MIRFLLAALLLVVASHHYDDLYRVLNGLTAGQNPQGGAVVDYHLRSAPRTRVTLEFLDARGALIRSFTSRQDSTVAADSVRAEQRRQSRLDSLFAIYPGKLTKRPSFRIGTIGKVNEKVMEGVLAAISESLLRRFESVTASVPAALYFSTETSTSLVERCR